MDGRTRKDHTCVTDSGGDHLACFAHGADYVGPDPVLWLHRLEDVNASAHWSNHDKTIIASAIKTLLRELST